VLQSRDLSGAWPIFVGHMPDTPDDSICIYDTPGFHEGRINSTGESVGKPGWQVRVRSTNFRDSYIQMKLIAAHLDGILRERVAVDGDVYVIQAVKPGTILNIGQEPDNKQRSLFTLNGTITCATTA